MPGTMPPVSPLERVALASHGLQGVDREQKVLRGYIVAELGPFKTPGRGEFDLQSLQKIVDLGNKKSLGLKSRFAHPGLSSDALGTHLGRVKNFSLDGGTKVRADLHFDPVAFDGPKGNLAKYVMDLAESDPDAIGSSLVLSIDKEYRLKEDGSKLKDDKGNDLPPLWRPKELYASDIVDEGDATKSLLSVEQQDDLPDAAVRMAYEALDRTFSGQDRLTTETRARAFLERYLTHRYGAPTPPPAGASVDLVSRKLRLLEHESRGTH